MPTLDWLNRSTAFTTVAQVPYRLFEPVSTHGDARSTADNLDHSLWLSMMLPRLQRLRKLTPSQHRDAYGRLARRGKNLAQQLDEVLA